MVAPINVAVETVEDEKSVFVRSMPVKSMPVSAALLRQGTVPTILPLFKLLVLASWVALKSGAAEKRP